MKVWMSALTSLAFLSACGVPGATDGQTSEASQLIGVRSNYRIVEKGLDGDEMRLGVALPDASPNRRQNWLYLKQNAMYIKRSYTHTGQTTDVLVSLESFYAQVKKGDVVYVEAGRDWDGSLDAKKVTLISY